MTTTTDVDTATPEPTDADLPEAADAVDASDVVTVGAPETEEPAEQAAAAEWDDEEDSLALQRARKDAEQTASADSVRAYLKLIGRVKLLTAEEEVDLARRVEAGLYATHKLETAAENGERLPVTTRRELTWVARDGERAKDHLLEANLRLVVSLAKR